jgi:regulation of enolase protein 1 (concanavalin A-like superfamily)
MLTRIRLLSMALLVWLFSTLAIAQKKDIDPDPEPDGNKSSPTKSKTIGNPNQPSVKKDSKPFLPPRTGTPKTKFPTTPQDPEQRNPMADDSSFGEIEDQDGDCKITEKDGKLSISVPATLHDLNPRNGKINAPRIVQELSGDFSVQVRVNGKFRPTLPSTAKNSVPFNGAGIIVWKDINNFVRLERNLWDQNGTYGCYTPLFEVRKNGQYLYMNDSTGNDKFFGGESFWLRMIRTEKHITGAWSQDGKKWNVVKEVELGERTRVKVGVSAINTSSTPFNVEFDEYRLIDDLKVQLLPKGLNPLQIKFN